MTTYVPNQTQTLMNKQVAPMPAIIIRGLPNSGKTLLANHVMAELRRAGIQAIHLNADSIRASLNSDLGFDPHSRYENARRIGAMTLLALDNGLVPVVDFVMPTIEAMNGFRVGINGRPYALWCVQRESDFRSRYADTQAIFQAGLGYPICYKVDEVTQAAWQVVAQSTALSVGVTPAEEPSVAAC